MLRGLASRLDELDRDLAVLAWRHHRPATGLELAGIPCAQTALENERDRLTARLGVLATADTLQDLPVRRAWFFHATWKDLLLRRLDLSAFVRLDRETDSRDQWLEARYHWDQVDLSMQWQRFSGNPGSVFGSIPQQQAVELALRYYF